MEEVKASRVNETQVASWTRKEAEDMKNGEGRSKAIKEMEILEP